MSFISPSPRAGPPNRRGSGKPSHRAPKEPPNQRHLTWIVALHPHFHSERSWAFLIEARPSWQGEQGECDEPASVSSESHHDLPSACLTATRS